MYRLAVFLLRLNFLTSNFSSFTNFLLTNKFVINVNRNFVACNEFVDLTNMTMHNVELVNQSRFSIVILSNHIVINLLCEFCRIHQVLWLHVRLTITSFVEKLGQWCQSKLTAEPCQCSFSA